MTNLIEWRKGIEVICQELAWKSRIQDVGEHLMIICPLASDAHFSGVLFVISDAASRLMMSVSYRAKASLKCRTAIYESISRINFGLLAGCLELDPERGEVRYRDGLFLLNTEADLELLRAFVATTLRDALQYYPDIETFASVSSLNQDD